MSIETRLPSKQNEMLQYPIKDTKKERQISLKTVFVIIFQGYIALEKRENNGLLSGLWGFPMIDGNIMKKDMHKLWNCWDSIHMNIIKEIKAKHIFTHVEWHMTGYFIQLEQMVNQDVWEFVSYQNIIKSYAIPSAFKAFIKELSNQ